MVDVTPLLPGLSPVQGKAVIARFDGGRLSSEGGLLVLREIESRLGVADRLAACLKDPRAPEKVVHRLALAPSAAIGPRSRSYCAPTAITPARKCSTGAGRTEWIGC